MNGCSNPLVQKQIDLFPPAPVNYERPDNVEKKITLFTTDNFPIPAPSLQEAESSMQELENFDGMSLIFSGEWNSRSVYDAKNTERYININRTGMSASNYHHWAGRMTCDSNNSPSPIRSWFDRKIKRSVESSKFYEKSPKTAIALRKYIAAQFRPTAAMAMYRRFNAVNVYDPCGGWGDRMLAAQAMGISYHCRDVNPLVFAGYSGQIAMWGGDISCEMKGSEVDEPISDYFDLAFTSPPYWKVEKYQGKDSSHAKFKKCDEWVSGFLKPMIRNTVESLVTGGVIAINISDCYANHEYNRLVTPTLEAISERCDLKEIIGYRLPVRSSKKITGIFCEPIVIGIKKR